LRLQVELATKVQARIMQWVVWGLVLLLLGLSIGLAVAKSDLQGGEDKPSKPRYYIAVLAIACACTATLLAFGGVFLVRWRRTLQQHKAWCVSGCGCT
jgi:hypothetical protein